MENERDSKEYSWRWVTTSQLLSKGPCDFIYSKHIPSSAATSTINLYHGTDANGELIAGCRTAASQASTIDSPVPLYCPKGLYYEESANVKGTLIVWRELGPKG